MSSKLTGGRTVTGQTINELGSKVVPAQLQANPSSRYGRILKVKLDRRSGIELYVVKLEWLGRKGIGTGKSDWIPIEDPPLALSEMYGEPKDIETLGKTMEICCRVHYRGSNANFGHAKIVRAPGDDQQRVVDSNTINYEGKSFAPPPGGMV